MSIVQLLPDFVVYRILIIKQKLSIRFGSKQLLNIYLVLIFVWNWGLLGLKYELSEIDKLNLNII